MKFICPLIVVEDIARSREFYEKTLGCKVKLDFGQNVAFEGDFAIHLRSHYEGLTGKKSVSGSTRPNNLELYFESGELESDYDKIIASGAEIVHELREQPWGQRVFRFYDPDGYIIEIGESLDSTARRFYNDGMTAEEIHARIGMPMEYIKQAIGVK
ncbi:MAG: glyoxalase/bleomycin resistance/dioxygenase family protein [Brevinematales bacterium]|nr:glyoxalase/bleomycin resistance/dioxygenase family protein [Brevinematales bacterium]